MVMVSSERSQSNRSVRSANLQMSSVLSGAEVFVVALEKVPDLCCAESRDNYYHDGLCLQIYLDVKSQTSLALIYYYLIVPPSVKSL